MLCVVVSLLLALWSDAVMVLCKGKFTKFDSTPMLSPEDDEGLQSSNQTWNMIGLHTDHYWDDARRHPAPISYFLSPSPPLAFSGESSSNDYVSSVGRLPITIDWEAVFPILIHRSRVVVSATAWMAFSCERRSASEMNSYCDSPRGRDVIPGARFTSCSPPKGACVHNVFH